VSGSRIDQGHWCLFNRKHWLKVHGWHRDTLVLSTQKLAVTVIENQTLEIDGEQKEK
jgi:hypothetical protein